MGNDLVNGILSTLTRRGIRLKAEGGQLLVCPKETVSDDLRLLLRTNKTAFLRRLESDPDEPTRRPLPCFARYGHRSGWRSVFGSHWICADCHPPATPGIVAETTEFDDVRKWAVDISPGQL